MQLRERAAAVAHDIRAAMSPEDWDNDAIRCDAVREYVEESTYITRCQDAREFVLSVPEEYNVTVVNVLQNETTPDMTVDTVNAIIVHNVTLQAVMDAVEALHNPAPAPVEILETPLYHFQDLDDSAKETARNWYRDGIGHDHWYDFIYEDFESICNRLGVTLKDCPGKPGTGKCIWWSGFYSQGDGASFEGWYSYAAKSAKKIREYAPQDEELHRIADELQAAQARVFYQAEATITQSGRYHHENTMRIEVERVDPRCTCSLDMDAQAEDDIVECMKNLARWLYRSLEREWDYMNSDEAIDENIIANEYTFTAAGEREG